MTDTPIPPNNFLLYTSEQGEVHVDVLLQNETIWLSQAQMMQLFQTTKQNISLHIKNVFEEGELEKNSTVKKYLTVQKEGTRDIQREIKFYNLDMIISVGYRVNSIRGTHFRIWATQRLKELIVKGFVLDNEKLKNPDNPFGKDYFDELLEQIRDIRSSEKRFYRKITDIYALAVDYDPKSEETETFFKAVQNSLLFASTGHTAAELIKDRSDASKENMGLTIWKGDKPRKADVTISKNYLSKEELDTLNRIVTMYLDYAELQAKNHQQMFAKDWREKLDAFLQFNNRDVLRNACTVTKEIADQLAIEEYEQFSQARLKEENTKENDFETAIKNLKK